MTCAPRGRGSSCVVAPSAAMLAAIERLHGPLRSTRVIPNARRAEAYLPGPKEDFVLAVGRLWDEAKNLAALDAVAPRLPFPVRVAGAFQHLGGGGRARAAHVQSLGALSPGELAGWMARAAVYALPARYEPFGLSVLEAALFVHPDDEDGLARALRGLMAHPAERERLARAARSRALTFTPRRMVEAYLELYAALRARPSGAWARPVLPAP